MNEIRMSTQVKKNTTRLAIKMDIKSLGLDWEKKDIIRVISNKKEGTLILKRVNKKYTKQVAYQLTSTGSGEYAHDLGIYVNYKPTRFKKELSASKMVNVGCRFISKDTLQIYMPQEIFKN